MTGRQPGPRHPRRHACEPWGQGLYALNSTISSHALGDPDTTWPNSSHNGTGE